MTYTEDEVYVCIHNCEFTYVYVKMNKCNKIIKGEFVNLRDLKNMEIVVIERCRGRNIDIVPMYEIL